MSVAPAQLDESERLERLVRNFRGRRVVVLGDLVVDEFVYGDISRISREAPVLILEQRKTVVVPGGGGNAVANLRALGAVPLPVGVVGEDEAGRRLVRELRARRVDVGGIVRLRGWDTPAKSRILAGGVHTRRQQIVRIDRGSAAAALPATAARSLAQRLRQALDGAEGLLVADYGYGVATPERLEAARASIERAGIPVTVDSRSRVLAFRGVTACTPNQEEVERALDVDPLPDETAVERAGRRLLRRTADRAVLITRGARGMSLFERRRPPLHVPAHGSDEVADVTGAGDTVIAVFTLGLLAGASFPDAARLANYAAGTVVLKAGTATLEPDELLRAIREVPRGAAMSGAAERVLELEHLAARLERERAAGRRVALANGLFDILHVGHLRYLEAAAREADLLVVGVNSDASARELKGPGRPVTPERERAELVAGFGCVRFVVIFGERSAERLLRTLRPDVHCKGTDYTVESVPESEVARELGIRVAIVGDPKRHATREIIRRLQGGGPGPHDAPGD